MDRFGGDWRDDWRDDWRADWRADPTIAPTVLLLGGFNTSPPLYRAFEARLLERGAAGVVVGRIWHPDWWLVPRRGHRGLVARAARGLLAADALSAERSKGAPVLVIGHSAGGLNARLLTSPVAFEGRRLAGAERIGAIVTLGSPHHIVSRWPHVATTARFADRHVPGAYWSPRTGYLAIASRALPGIRRGSLRERARWHAYAHFLGLSSPPSPPARSLPDELEGDGVVPLATALLDGARTLVLDDVEHGVSRRTWYGADDGLERWWDLAVATWREALDVRRADAPTGPAPATRPGPA